MVPRERVFTDPLHLLAYGSDASFYRLLPKAVVKVHSEAEVVALLQLAQRHQVPVTFRAAGTSLSGQATTDSILIKVCGGGGRLAGWLAQRQRRLPVFTIVTHNPSSLVVLLVTCEVYQMGRAAFDEAVVLRAGWVRWQALQGLHHQRECWLTGSAAWALWACSSQASVTI